MSYVTGADSGSTDPFCGSQHYQGYADNKQDSRANEFSAIRSPRISEAGWLVLRGDRHGSDYEKGTDGESKNR